MITRFFALLAFFIVLVSCSSRDDDASNSQIDCLNLGTQDLTLTIQESFTELQNQGCQFLQNYYSDTKCYIYFP